MRKGKGTRKRKRLNGLALAILLGVLVGMFARGCDLYRHNLTIGDGAIQTAIQFVQAMQREDHATAVSLSNYSTDSLLRSAASVPFPVYSTSAYSTSDQWRGVDVTFRSTNGSYPMLEITLYLEQNQRWRVYHFRTLDSGR